MYMNIPNDKNKALKVLRARLYDLKQRKLIEVLWLKLVQSKEI